jgi:sortase A
VLFGAVALVLVADAVALAAGAASAPRTAPVAVAADAAVDSPVPAHQPAPSSTAPPTTLLPVPIDAPDDAYAPEPLTQIGTLSIPAIGLETPMFEGITLPTIDHGPSHWPGSAWPGQLGNVVIAGHRVTHTHPFRHIDELEPGDTATFTTAAGTFTYSLVSEEIVDPEAFRIVDQTMAYTATMFACHPPGSSRERIVAHWQMVDAPSVPVPGAEQAAVAGN